MGSRSRSLIIAFAGRYLYYSHSVASSDETKIEINCVMMTEQPKLQLCASIDISVPLFFSGPRREQLAAVDDFDVYHRTNDHPTCLLRKRTNLRVHMKPNTPPFPKEDTIPG